MKRKNASKNPKLQNIPKAKERPPLKQQIDKKWYIAGAAALVALVVLSIGLIWFYADPMDATVARLNGQNITARQVYGEMITGISREDAARAAARNILISDYARELGISLAGHEQPGQIMDMIARNIADDPARLAEFEPYMAVDDAHERAIAVQERALAGEDFTELRMAYCQDFGQPMEEGYTFVTGAMVDEFYEATKELAIGEISEPVRSQFGYHIIKRVEPIPENVMLAPGQAELEEDQELLGARHILISAPSFEQRLALAMPMAFETRFGEANFETLRALDSVTVD